jgi:hypothetical protein
MIRKYATYTAFGFILLIIYNIFLIQRDDQMFKNYDKINAKEYVVTK